MIQFILVSILCFLGLFLGVILAFIAKEIELKPGKKYFIIIRRFVFSLIIAAVLYHLNMVLAFLLGGFCYFILKKIEKQKISYWLLGLFLFFGSFSPQFLIIASLVLFYGFVQGTLDSDKLLKKSIWNVLVLELKNHYLFLGFSLIPKIVLNLVQSL
ncbi:MAG: hypothetical protein MAG795_00728 [Candidatus Woesearchaeota archaeon]|nr:hypothetical protein [Candidatus Woesearchaeota archaeon]